MAAPGQSCFILLLIPKFVCLRKMRIAFELLKSFQGSKALSTQQECKAWFLKLNFAESDAGKNHVNSINKRSFISSAQVFFFDSNNFVYRSGSIAQTAKNYALVSFSFVFFFRLFFNFHLIVSPIPFRLQARLSLVLSAAKRKRVERERAARSKKKILNNLSSRDASTVHEYIVSFHLF